MVKTKQIFRIICALLIIVLSAFFFVACNKNGLEYKQIVISDREDTITSTGLEIAISNLLQDVVKLRLTSVPQAMLEEINDFSQEADTLLRSYPITEKQYSSLKDDLVKNRTQYSISIYNLYKGELDSNNNIKGMISNVIRTLGKGMTSYFAYDIISYRLNYIYLDYKSTYDKAHIKEKEMNEAKYNYDTFTQKIEVEDFDVILTNGLIIWDLLSTNTSGGFSLSNAEIATLIQIPNFSVSIDAEAWTLILKLLGQNVLGSGYYGELFEKAIENDELQLFGAKMHYVVELINSIQSKIDEEVVSSLSGGIVDILYSLMPSFEESDWALLENIFDITVNTNYWQIGYMNYGSDYTNYSDNVTKYIVEDLKTATRENVSVIFEGIIANIHPAFSYGWNND